MPYMADGVPVLRELHTFRILLTSWLTRDSLPFTGNKSNSKLCTYVCENMLKPGFELIYGFSDFALFHPSIVS